MLAHEVFGLDRAALAELAREAVRASFASERVRTGLLAEIDSYVGS